MAVVATKFPLSVLQKELISFDGEKGSLCRFISVCESVMGLVKEEDKIALFTLIKLKLIGKAYNLTKYRVMENWKDMKDILEELFSEKRSQGQWELELHSARQKRNESASEFATRVENILANLINCVTSGQSREACTHYENLLRAQAMNVFIQGLSENFKIIVKARNPKTLEDAIELAVAEEREYESHIESQRFIRRESCTICGKSNHISKDCFKNKNKYKAPNLNVLSLNETKVCKYCKNKGHLIEECRKRKFNEEKKKALNSAGPSGDGGQRAANYLKAGQR